ncbi:hypothetical protein MMC18_008073 [Xylographa bjoerkii]|nr:hypothetical protein [Xylographa bjoerkii]
MDPLSGVASVVAVLQFASSVLSTFYFYQERVRHAKKDILYLAAELESLRDFLKSLKTITDDEDAGSKHLETVTCLTRDALQQCLEKLTVLDEKLTPRHGWKVVGQGLSWPLKADDVNKIHDDLERFKSTLLLALGTDSAKVLLSVRNQTNDLTVNLGKLTSGFDNFQRSPLNCKILKWISATDPPENQVRASKLRHSTTGEWLLHSTDFLNWRDVGETLLWLHGSSGCGKTVLCSTIVENVLEYCRSNPGVHGAYYYLDFTNAEKRKPANLVRSLVAQFADVCDTAWEPLEALYTNLKTSQCFIIVDALDEFNDTEDLIKTLKRIVESKRERSHVLVTSQSQRSIGIELEKFVITDVVLYGDAVDEDIELYIREKVRADSILGRRPPHVQWNIEDALTKGANGM